MHRRVTCLIAAALAIATGSHTVKAAVPAPNPPGNVEILVDGAPQRRYAHDGRWYVEALKGKEYAIRLHNPFGVRVAVALSVDGLNTIDARQTTAADARKWVINPYQTVIISGWQTSQSEARRFEFTTEARSYGQALGKTANLGVISAVFFRERVSAVAREPLSQGDRQAPAARASAPQDREASAGAAAQRKRAEEEEYAATGMGRPTEHFVTRVRLDLESAPAQTVNIRYEFRPQLVRLGILPPVRTTDPLQRREDAQGFEPGFAPVPPRYR
jgi:hypothetical protein